MGQGHFILSLPVHLLQPFDALDHLWHLRQDVASAVMLEKEVVEQMLLQQMHR